MIRGIGRALARVTHKKETPAQKMPQPSSAGAADRLDKIEAARAPLELVLPSALGIAPPKIVRIDMVALTKAGDDLWAEKRYDKACGEYETLCKRFMNEPLPVAKLMVAYDAMGEHRGFRMASQRLATLLPNPRARAMCFLKMFDDRPAEPSSAQLDLRLAHALTLGEAQLLSVNVLASLLEEARCGGMPLLAHAVTRGGPKDLDAVLNLVTRVGQAQLADQVTAALTLAEDFGRSDKLEAMLRSGLKPTTAAHLDRLVDKAFAEVSDTLLQVLFETCLSPAQMRAVDGQLLTLGQVVLAAKIEDYTLQRKIGVLAANGALRTPVVAGDDYVVMAIRRGGKAVAAILDHGVDIERRDPKTGNTLLIEAASRGAAGSVGVLLGRGARVDAVNQAGLDAADMARLQGFTAIEKQMQVFPAQSRFEKLLTLMWGTDTYGTMATLRTEVYNLGPEQMQNLLTYAAPLLGFGALPEDFATTEPWTLQRMRARKLPVVGWAEHEQAAWRYVTRNCVEQAARLTALQWQGLAEILEGLKTPYWVADVLQDLLGDTFINNAIPATQWKALANSISGNAYRNLPVQVRCRVIRTALDLRRRYGSTAGAALDYLNEIPVAGFDGRAYWSVMWDFVMCAAGKGDCAALAHFAREDVKTLNRMGLKLSLTERLKRHDEFGKSLWGAQKKGAADTADTTFEDKAAAQSFALTQAYKAVRGTHKWPWASQADADCADAIRLCLSYFSSASEMENIHEFGAEARVLDMLTVIFGWNETLRLFNGSVEAHSYVRKLLLLWHPDKLSAENKELGDSMTTLLLTLRERLDNRPFRELLIKDLDRQYPRGEWRQV